LFGRERHAQPFVDNLVDPYYYHGPSHCGTLALGQEEGLGATPHLLDVGAYVNAANYRGETVLMRFAGEMGEIFSPHHEDQNNVTSLTMLLDAGADVNAVDEQGRTVLHYFTKTCDQLLRVYPQREKSNPSITGTRESALPCLELLSRR